MNDSLLISINNALLPVSSSNVLFQSCLLYEIYLPRFCYHASLSIAGNCRMCLIEEKNSLKPLLACATSCEEGQVIYTNTEVVAYAREGVLEFLLINHPLDCPICDQGGECDLQDQVIVFGADTGRFYEDKKTVPNKDLGVVIKTFFNRCIYCTRCVRYFEEFGDDNELVLLGRSEDSEIGTYVDKYLLSEISGNVADLCPVGALLIKPSSFRGRLWEYDYYNTFDIMDALGSEIRVDLRGLEIIRVLPKTNSLLNDEWVSDRARFFFEALDNNRFVYPMFEQQIVGWDSIFFGLRNTWGSNLILSNGLSLNVCNSVFCPSEFSDVETLIVIKEMMLKIGTPSFLSFWHLNKKKTNLNNNLYLFSSIFEDETMTDKENLIFIGFNLRFSSPVLNMRLKRLVNEIDLKIYTLGALSNTNYSVFHLGNNYESFYKLTHDENFKENSLIYISQEYKNNFFFKSEILHYYISDVGVQEIDFNLFSLFPFSRLNFEVRDNSTLLNDFLNTRLQIEFITHETNNIDKTGTISIPTSIFLERGSSYLNNYGDLLQEINFAESDRIFVAGKIVNWKLLRAVANSFGDSRSFISLKQLRSRFLIYSYNFVYNSQIIFKNRKLTGFVNVYSLSQLLFKYVFKTSATTALVNNILGKFSWTLSTQERLMGEANDYSFCRL